MSISIYNVQNWQANTQYSTNDVVLNGQYYYYATTNFTSSNNFTTDFNAGNFVGTTTYNNQTYQFFTWKPSYNLGAEYKPTIKQIQFGDGYLSIQQDSINNLVTLNLQFANRTLSETTAINQFLYAMAGYQSFAFMAPPPNATLFLYKCLQWKPNEVFFDNFTTDAIFTQVVR